MLFAAQILRSFLQRKQIATLQELKAALGTISTMTVFRKLGFIRPCCRKSQLNYQYLQESCAHREPLPKLVTLSMFSNVQPQLQPHL
jgi:hypothetical protein